MSETQVHQRAALPVLFQGDVIVAGGSLAGAACALAAAQAGRKVLLVEPRAYLGRELTATLRPWLEPADGPLPALVERLLAAAGGEAQPDGTIPLQPHALKRALEDELLAAGVELLYGSQPAGLVREDGRAGGIVIGNKSGRQALLAPAIVDATETSLLARLAGAQAPQAGEPAQYWRSLEFDRVGGLPPGELALPAALGVDGNRARWRTGSRGAGHGYLEVPLRLERNVQDAAAWTAREIQARAVSMQVVAYLLREVPAFARAYFAAGAQQVHGPAPALVPWTGQAAAAEGLDALRGPLAGLLVLGDAPDPLAAARSGAALGAWIAAQPAHPPRLPAAMADGPEPPQTGLQAREPAGPQRGRAYPRVVVPPAALPILGAVDVLVVGGGTSGATAATVAARAGARALLLESNPGLGGTGTFGGVHSYWFGRRTGYAREVIAAVEAQHAALGMEPPEGGLLKWNIEAKMQALLARALDAGAAVLWGAVVTGALVEGGRVVGVVAATPFGPAAFRAQVVVDATGDGDVAAFAGAEFAYGAERDHLTMWYALAQFHRPGVTNNNFTSMVDVGNVVDTTRAILAGRRRAEGYEAGSYIAPRESRHILGDVVLTLNDQLLKRCWPDVVNIAFSNHDVKGHTSSDWLRAGLIPPNLEIEVPYRALLPRGLDGIIVTGKAISATHDAQPAVRMQPDLENLGGVAGLAAAQAARAGSSPRALDVRALQAALVEAGVLPESILTRVLRPRDDSPMALERLVEQIDPGKPLWSYQDMDLDVVFEGNIPLVELCCAGPRAVPVLERAFAAASGAARTMLARALALVGATAGVPALIEAIHAETPDEGLQYRTSHIRHVNLPPDQGAAPEAVYLLYTLGMARDARALPVWEHFAGLIAATGERDLRDRSLGLFYYVDAICYGAERLGDPRAIPLLRQMQANPIFRNQRARSGFQPDFFLERQAYLELVIARALARCGDESGYQTLVDYLEDARALLAEHAHSELARLTGQDFGKDRQAWLGWLAQTRAGRKPVPLADAAEATAAWGETILTQ